MLRRGEKNQFATVENLPFLNDIYSETLAQFLEISEFLNEVTSREISSSFSIEWGFPKVTLNTILLMRYPGVRNVKIFLTNNS